ncbi:hypothetical protein GCM10011506_29870 [Marivirga lumbricoides]|uniref:Uncharacterized protein n=2 Tax=Marivirga lumbricoides TaxID=1046115 RepID=A0ABQ1MPP0_9BACT|nr:hypothetical protein GCM10011506_29870 [Marivirga lumbricoides]
MVKRSEVLDFKEASELSFQDMQQWKDKAGKNRLRVELAEIDASNAKMALAEKLQETIRKDIGNIRKNLISYSTVKASTSDSLNIPLIDTVYLKTDNVVLSAKKFTISDDHLNMEGLYLPSLDTLSITYEIIHNFDITYYYRKPGKKPFNLFKKKQAIAEIKFDNPQSQADSLYTIILERKPSFLSKLFN